MANAADNFQWNADNVFDSWDLNPLAQQVGAGADGVRDTLAQKRDEYLQPLMQQYRSQYSGANHAAEDDQSLFNNNDFQNFVKTGQGPNTNTSVTQQWNQSSAPQLAPATPDPRQSALYDALLKRSNPDQVTNLDPNVRAQSDANIANEERARRNYISDVAEREGPNANIQGERRMAAERAGQRTGAFEANLVGQEIKAQREQVAQALTQMGGMLSDDQKIALQERLANLDAVLKDKGLSLQDKSINNDMERALLGNDQFMRQLGLNEWDRTNYWDALKSGYLG